MKKISPTSTQFAWQEPPPKFHSSLQKIIYSPSCTFFNGTALKEHTQNTCMPLFIIASQFGDAKPRFTGLIYMCYCRSEFIQVSLVNQ